MTKSFPKYVAPCIYMLLAAIVAINIYFLMTTHTRECTTPDCLKVSELYRKRDSTFQSLFVRGEIVNKMAVQHNKGDTMLLGAEAVNSHNAVLHVSDSIIAYFLNVKNRIIKSSGGLDANGNLKYVLDDRAAKNLLFKKRAADTLNQMAAAFLALSKNIATDAGGALDSVTSPGKWKIMWDEKTVPNYNIIAVCSQLLDNCSAMKKIQVMETAMYLEKKGYAATQAKVNLQETIEQMEHTTPRATAGN